MLPRSLDVVVLLLCSLVAALVAAEVAAAERRVALVLGNSAYVAAGLALENPRTDAEDVARALNGLGFEVLLVTDADKTTTDRAIETFARMASGADTALFFYAGHALQYEGRNYLLPIDADVRDEIGLPFATVTVETIRRLLERSDGIKIMVLDACRNNPVAERLALRPPDNSFVVASERTRGLHRADMPRGLIVAYAAAPDSVALDGQGRNSPYTTAFLRRLGEAGLEIGTMFRRIAADVDVATGGRQRPETFVSMVSDYYLNRNDKIAWEQIADQDDAAALRDFIETFPSSYYALEAQYKLRAIERAIAAETERRAAEQLAAARRSCEAERAALAAVGDDDLPRLDELASAAGCDAVRQEAVRRAEAAKASRTRRAELCRQEAAQFQSLAPKIGLGEIADLRRRATCPATLTLIDRKAAEIAAAVAAACMRDKAALAKADGRDPAALRELARTSACPEVAVEADRRAAEVESGLAREAATCARDEAAWRAVATSHDRAEIEALRRRLGCERVIGALDARLADLAKTCRREEAALARIGPRDAEALRGFVASAGCAAVATAARGKLAALETTLAAEAEACRRDEKAWTEVAATTDRAGAEALRRRVACPAVAATIDAALAQLPAPPKPETFDTPAQVRAAQAELARLGCFEGKRTGKLDVTTKKGLARYFAAKGTPAASESQIAIGDKFLAELKQQDKGLCAGPAVAEPAPEKAPPGRKAPSKTAARPPAKASPADQRQAGGRPARSAPVVQDLRRRAPAASGNRPPSPWAVGGAAPAGGSGRGSAVTGVGF